MMLSTVLNTRSSEIPFSSINALMALPIVSMGSTGAVLVLFLPAIFPILLEILQLRFLDLRDAELKMLQGLLALPDTDLVEG